MSSNTAISRELIHLLECIIPPATGATYDWSCNLMQNMANYIKAQDPAAIRQSVDLNEQLRDAVITAVRNTMTSSTSTEVPVIEAAEVDGAINMVLESNDAIEERIKQNLVIEAMLAATQDDGNFMEVPVVINDAACDEEHLVKMLNALVNQVVVEEESGAVHLEADVVTTGTEANGIVPDSAVKPNEEVVHEDPVAPPQQLAAEGEAAELLQEIEDVEKVKDAVTEARDQKNGEVCAAVVLEEDPVAPPQQFAAEREAAELLQEIEEVEKARNDVTEARDQENGEVPAAVDLEEDVELKLTRQFEELKRHLMSQIDLRVEEEVERRMVEIETRIYDRLKKEMMNGELASDSGRPSLSISSMTEGTFAGITSNPTSSPVPRSTGASSSTHLSFKDASSSPKLQTKTFSPPAITDLDDDRSPSPPLQVPAVPRSRREEMREERERVLEMDLTKEAERFLCGAKQILFDRQQPGIRQLVLSKNDIGPDDFKKFAAENPDGAETIDDEEANRRYEVYVEVRKKQQGVGLIRTKFSGRGRRKRRTFEGDVYYGGKKRKFQERRDDNDGGAGAGIVG